MCDRRGIRMRQPLQMWNIGCKFQNFTIIDFIDHGGLASVTLLIWERTSIDAIPKAHQMSNSDLDETLIFTPRFDAAGLIAAIVQDAGDGTVLMFAHMNAEALQKSRETGLAHFYSRSRAKLWLKGESSDETFAVVEIRVDCDMDCVLLKVTPQGPKGVACHTGRRSCFYRLVGEAGLEMI